ncbi:MAG: glycosyltransferase family 39 protein [Chloroflexi bacterium]|nr:MAG: glycosyltransferase family 39 protein [Chloroflexota bacterium]
MRLRLLAAFCIVAATGWWLGSFRTEVFHRGAAHMYSVDFKGARWIQASTGAPRSYFHFDLPLQAVPDSATLWVDSNQWYDAYVDGRRIDSDASDVKAAVPAKAHGVDLTRWLVAGQNTVALDVSNANTGTASMRARLVLVTNGKETDYSTSSPGWRATSNSALVKPRGSLHLPQFFSVKYDASAWPAAVPSPTVRTAIVASVPEQVMEQPFNAEAISTPNPTREMAASVIVDLPGQPTDGWIRVASSGPYGLFLNGDLLTYRSQAAFTGKGVPAEVLNLFNLGQFFHPGVNVLAFHVTASPVATLYVDGTIQTTAGSVTINSGQNWSAVPYPFGNALTAPSSTDKAAFIGTTSIVWPQGLAKRVIGVNKVDTPPSVVYLDRFATLGGTLALWVLAAGLVGLIAGIPFRRALLTDAVGHLPGMAAIGVLLALLGTVFAGKVVSGLVVTGVTERVALWVMAGWQRLRRLRVPEMPQLPQIAHRVGGLLMRWEVAAVGIVSLICGGAALYRIGYEPLWQDELASLLAAQGVRSHLLPSLPSGLLYFKGELYSALLAVVGAITGDTATPLRIPSALWYVATILAFGLLLLPMVIKRRSLLLVATTVLFATAPMELLWSRDVRMYQQAQFFAILFIVFFAKALQRPRTRTIAAAAVTMLLMYLSHEETFIFLPAIPVVFLVAMRLRWVRDWRWWVFGGGAFALIGVQYLLTAKTHPPFFGFDHSDKPYVTYDAHNFYWYISKVYFPTATRAGGLALVSSFAVIAGVTGAVRRNFMRLYISAFLWIPVLALSTVFSPKIARYVFVTIPLLFVLAALGAVDVIGALRSVLSAIGSGIRERRAVIRLVAVATVPGFAWLGLSLTGGAGDYGLAFANATGATVAYAHTDYSGVGSYMRAHEKPGDLFVTLAPPDDPAYYVGRVPNMTIATGRDKLLFLMEKDGSAVDTNFGVPAILTVGDLQKVIENHRRVWIMTDQGSYLTSVAPAITNLIKDQFDVVAETATAALYFRGD